MAQPEYLRITEHQNAIDSLRRGVRFLEESQSDKLMWKWSVIALHDALYGFAVCVCQGTDSSHLMSKGNPDFLRSFQSVLDRCQADGGMHPFSQCRRLQLNAVQKSRIEHLKDVRNDFAHFAPKGWSIELHGLTLACHEALKAIRFIVLESGASIAYASESNDATEHLLKSGIAFIEGLPLFAEAIESLQAEKPKGAG